MTENKNDTRHVLLVGDKDPYSKWQGYAEEFVRRGWRVTVLFYYRNPIETGESRITQTIRTIVIGPDAQPRYEPAPDLVDFVEQTAGYGSLPKFLFNEIFLYDRTYEEVVAEANAMWPQLTHLFESTRFDLVVQNQGAGPLRRLVFALAKQREIPVLYFDVAWFGDRMFVSDNEMNRVTEYRPIPSDEISHETRDAVTRFRNERLEKRPTYQYYFPERPRIDLASRLSTTANKLRKKNLFRSVRFRIARLRKRLRSTVTDLFLDRFLSTSVPEEPFFFLPLHYPKDSQLALRSQQFLRQEDLVEFVHWNLPHGAVLVVKAHPHAKGDYERSALRKIRRLPNCRMIRSTVSAHKILEHRSCRGTIVLNSSVGFESILHGKPVIALGDFYGIRYGDLVQRTDTGGLAKTLKDCMSRFADDESVMAALSSIYEACLPGTIYSENVDYSTVVDSLLQRCAELRRST